jgi:hypothetical protein
MTVLPAPADLARPRRAPRYYVFRLRQDRHGGEPLIDIVGGPMADLIVAWRAAGNWRKFYNSAADRCGSATFIAGDMDATLA